MVWCANFRNNLKSHLMTMGCTIPSNAPILTAPLKREVLNEQLAHMKKDSINLFLTRRSTLLFIWRVLYGWPKQGVRPRPWLRHPHCIARLPALLFNCLIEREDHYHQIGFLLPKIFDTICRLWASICAHHYELIGSNVGVCIHLFAHMTTLYNYRVIQHT